MIIERLAVYGPDHATGYYFVVFSSTAKNYTWGFPSSGPDFLELKLRWATDPYYALSMSSYPYAHMNPTITMPQVYEAHRVINGTGDFVQEKVDLEVVAKARAMKFDPDFLDELVRASKVADDAAVEAAILLNRIRHFKA